MQNNNASLTIITSLVHLQATMSVEKNETREPCCSKLKVSDFPLKNNPYNSVYSLPFTIQFLCVYLCVIITLNPVDSFLLPFQLCAFSYSHCDYVYHAVK